MLPLASEYNRLSKALACPGMLEITGAVRQLQLVARSHGATGKNLEEEIDDLASKGLILPSMTELAHEVREYWRMRGHMPQPCTTGTNEKDAKDVVEFLSFLMTVMYNLPKQIKKLPRGEELSGARSTPRFIYNFSRTFPPSPLNQDEVEELECMVLLIKAVSCVSQIVRELLLLSRILSRRFRQHPRSLATKVLTSNPSRNSDQSAVSVIAASVEVSLIGILKIVEQ